MVDVSIVIENQQIIARFATKGAELISLESKETGIEYIWQADPAYWNRHAPVLYPFVGRSKDDQYTYKGVTYPMGQHGFARDKEFSIKEQKADEITFMLQSDEETRKVYPFDFELLIEYRLGGDGIIVEYFVTNTGNEEMYFSIGGHPAFNVPLEKGLTFEDYYLKFSPQKSRIRIPLVGPYIDLNQRTLGQTNTSIALTHELFVDDALIFETRDLNAFSICSDKSPHNVTLSYNNMPFAGIWSPYPKESPFVCIEPWCGIADRVDSNGELTEKTGVNRLDPGKQFTHKYAITVK